MDIKGAIFDMDGTLVDSLMVWDVLWEAFGEKYLGDKKFRPDSDTEKKVRTLSLADAMELLHEKSGIGKDGEELLDFANEMLEKFYREDVKLKTGVREFLVHCYENGVQMCIASATARNLVELSMKTCKIEKYFKGIVSCADVGKSKEFPDVFIAANKFLGTPKECTYVFEDSVAAIETATKAGYKTVGIYDKYNFNLEKVAEISTVYIAEGETLEKLV